MQYLVREVLSKVGSKEGKIFKTLPDAVKHVQKITQSEKLLLDQEEGTLDLLDLLERVLSERLATVSLCTDIESKRQWVITAFE